MGKNSPKKTGIKKFLSRIIKRKTSSKENPQSTLSLPYPDDNRNSLHQQQPNDGKVDNDLSVTESQLSFKSGGDIDEDKIDSDFAENVSIANMSRRSRPLFLGASGEVGLHDRSTGDNGSQSSGQGAFCSLNNSRHTNTNKAMQLLQKFQTKKCDISNVNERPFAKQKKGRSNKELVSMVQIQMNTSHESSELRTAIGSDVDNSSCSDMSEVDSISSVSQLSLNYKKDVSPSLYRNTSKETIKSRIPLATKCQNQQNDVSNTSQSKIPQKIKIPQAFKESDNHVANKQIVKQKTIVVECIPDERGKSDTSSNESMEVQYQVEPKQIRPQVMDNNKLRNKTQSKPYYTTNQPEITLNPTKSKHSNVINKSVTTNFKIELTSKKSIEHEMPAYRNNGSSSYKKIATAQSKLEGNTFENPFNTCEQDVPIELQSSTKFIEFDKPLASSTLQTSKFKVKLEPKEDGNLSSPDTPKKMRKKRKSDKAILVTESNGIPEKHDNHQRVVQTDVSGKTNIRESYKTTETKKKDQTADEKHPKRKRSNKVKGPSGLQTLLLDNLCDRKPIMAQGLLQQNGNSQVESPIQSINVESPNKRPIIHYHVTLQNCDGININVNKKDSEILRPKSIELSQIGSMQRISWIEDNSAIQTPTSMIPIQSVPNINRPFGPLTNSGESWSERSSTDTVIAGYDPELGDFVDNRSEISCDTTTTTVLMSTETDIDHTDNVSEVTCDTAYLVDADAWGCDALENDDLEHLSVCEHFDYENKLQHMRFREQYLNNRISNQREPFHLKRNTSVTRSVPDRLSKGLRKRSPSGSRSKEFLPPWRSDSSNSVPAENGQLKPTKNNKVKCIRAQSCNIPGEEFVKGKSGNSKDKHKDKKSKPSAASRLLHNLLSHSKSKEQHNEKEKKTHSMSNILHKNKKEDNNYSSKHSLSSKCTSQENCKKKDTCEPPVSVTDPSISENNATEANNVVQFHPGQLQNISNSLFAQAHDTNNSDTPPSVNNRETSTNNHVHNNAKVSSKQIILPTRSSTNDGHINYRTSEPGSSTNKRDGSDILKNHKDKNNKPVAKVVPVQRVSPQPATTPASVTPVSQSYYNNTTSSHLAIPTSASPYISHAGYTPTANINYSINGADPSAITSSAITLSPMYVSPYSRRYTPLFTSTLSPATSSSWGNSTIPTVFSNVNTGNNQSNLVAAPNDSMHGDNDMDSSSDSDSTISIGENNNTTTISPAYDDSTLSLLQASPHFVIVDEDMDAPTTGSAFSRFGLGSTIQPTLRRHNNSDHSRGRRSRREHNGPTLEERVASLRGEIVRVPGVLILSTRRNRMVVYLSQDRPNTDGVLEFMHEHGVNRADFEVEVLPWRGGRASNANVSIRRGSSRPMTPSQA